MPVILSAHVIHVTQYEIMVFIDAYDPENDELLYIFDWGDGSIPFETNSPFASYTYPENVYRDYPLSVMATDGLQQSSEYTDTVSIAQPPTNQAPEVQDIEIIVSPRGVVDLRVIANDQREICLRLLLIGAMQRRKMKHRSFEVGRTASVCISP